MQKIALRQAIIGGIISGLLFTAFTFGTYYSGINSFAGFSFIYVFVPLVLVVVLILGFNLRKQMGGFISFKEVLQYSMVVYLVYEIVVAIVTYILYVVIDPQLTQKLLQVTMKFTTDFMKSMGAPQDQIDKALSDSKKQPPVTDLKNIFLGVAWSLILGFIKSLLAAWIIKKDRPADLDFEPKPVV